MSPRSRFKKNIFLDWVDMIGGPKLAKLLDIDPSTISHWRRGKCPKVDHMRRIRELSEGAITYDHIIDGPRGGGQ